MTLSEYLWFFAVAGGPLEAASDVLWAYETPNEEARQIAGYGAFDPEKVAVEAIPDESPREKMDMA